MKIKGNLAKKTIIMGDKDVKALVIDNGSRMCKAGFAEDDAFRAPLHDRTPETPGKLYEMLLFLMRRCKKNDQLLSLYFFLAIINESRKFVLIAQLIFCKPKLNL